MGYWKSKVLPKIKKIFESNGTKKSAAAEVCKSFDESKEEYSKLFEEKKHELQPKVVEIYEASSTEIKTLVKEPREAGLRKHSAEVQKFINELAKIEFPGSKEVDEATSKFGPALVPGPVFFLFEKVSTFVVTEEKEEAPAPTTTTAEGGETAVQEEKEREIVVEEVEAAVDAAEEKKTTEPAAAKPPASTEPPKAEEAAPPPAPAAAEPPKP